MGETQTDSGTRHEVLFWVSSVLTILVVLCLVHAAVMGDDSFMVWIGYVVGLSIVWGYCLSRLVWGPLE